MKCENPHPQFTAVVDSIIHILSQQQFADVSEQMCDK